MNVAVYLTGHVRTYLKTHKAFQKNIIEPNNNIDVFISTYNHTDTKISHNYLYTQNSNYIGNFKQILNMESIDVNEIIDTYDPVSIHIENESDYRECNKYTDRVTGVTYPTASMNMYNKWRQIDIMRKEYERTFDKRYNAILKTRFDVAYPIKCNFNDIDINKNVLYNGFYTDVSFFGCEKIISSLCNIYDYVDGYMNHDLQREFNVENIFLAYLKDHNIDLKTHEGMKGILIR